MSRHLQKRSFKIQGHATSVALEPEFWAIIDAIATQKGMSLPSLISEIEESNLNDQPLASKMRVFCLKVDKL